MADSDCQAWQSSVKAGHQCHVIICHLARPRHCHSHPGTQHRGQDRHGYGTVIGPPPHHGQVGHKDSLGTICSHEGAFGGQHVFMPSAGSIFGNQHLIVGATKPRLREIDSPLTWASCFLAYAAVKTTDQATHNLLTYGRLVIREAQDTAGRAG